MTVELGNIAKNSSILPFEIYYFFRNRIGVLFSAPLGAILGVRLSIILYLSIRRKYKLYLTIHFMIEELKNRIIKQIGIKEGDKVLHLLNGPTMFSNLIATSVTKKGLVHVLNFNDKKIDKKEHIEFHENISEMEIDPDSLDLILFEDCFFYIKDKYEGMRHIKKYLTPKGKVAIVEPKDFFISKLLKIDRKRKINDVMFHSGYRLKNEFNFTNKYNLIIYEKE